jgi:hypothetical protein
MTHERFLADAWMTLIGQGEISRPLFASHRGL